MIALVIAKFCGGNMLNESLLSPNVLSKSFLYTGQLKIGLLNDKKCLRIAVIGGSITRGCGRLQYHPDAPGDDPLSPEFGCNYANAYGSHLENELNLKYPCSDPSTENRHIVIRMKQAGAPVDNVIENLVRYKSESDEESLLMRKVDLLIVDLSVNDALDVFSDIDGVSLVHAPNGDMQQRWGEGQDQDADAGESRLLTSLKGFYELLIGVVQSFPNKPNLLFLGTSLNLNRPKLQDQSTIYVQQEIARYYNIPVVSVLDMFGYANHSDIMSPTMLEWFKNGGWMIGNGDCCHITKTAHRILAKVILHGIEVSSTPGFMFGAEHRSPDTPLFAPVKKFQVYVNAIPFLITTNNDARDEKYRVDSLLSSTTSPSQPTPAPGWVFSSEKGKWGLISTTPGSKIIYRVQPEHTANMQQNILHVTALKSYEHMGVARVSVYHCVSDEDFTVASSATDSNSMAQLIVSADIDFQWENKNSQAHVEELQLGDISLRGACLQIMIENVSPDGRGHKIKLFSLTLI